MWSLVAFAEPWIAAPGIAETVRRFCNLVRLVQEA
ncbi:hypothetical protein SFUMM280S_00909 [Streptomyces fumanus]